jgi:serine/threonine-protein kinase
MPKGNHPNRWEIARRQFKREAVTLNKLGSHDQIPQLLDCFEDNQGFYLVQQLIDRRATECRTPKKPTL